MAKAANHISTIVVMVAALLLGGCGYKPLYGQLDDAGSLDFSDIEINPQSSRTGQLVRNELLAGIAPAMRRSRKKRYVLDFSISEADDTTIISHHSRYTMRAKFTLVAKGNGMRLLSGKTFAEASYTKVRQPVANMQARINASKRAARVIADNIRTRIAAHLASSN